MAIKNIKLKYVNDILLPQTNGTNILSTGVEKDHYLVSDGKGFVNWQEIDRGTILYKHEINAYCGGTAGNKDFWFISTQPLPCANISDVINMIPKTIGIYAIKATGSDSYVKDSGFHAVIGGTTVVVNFPTPYASSSYALESISHDIVKEI